MGSIWDDCCGQCYRSSETLSTWSKVYQLVNSLRCLRGLIVGWAFQPAKAKQTPLVSGTNRMLMVLQRLGLLCLLWGLFLWAVPSQAGRAYPPKAALFDHTHADWAKLLLRAVHTDQGGSVSKLDYQVFLDDKHSFDNYLKALSAVSVEQFKGFSRPAQH